VQKARSANKRKRIVKQPRGQTESEGVFKKSLKKKEENSSPNSRQARSPKRKKSRKLKFRIKPDAVRGYLKEKSNQNTGAWGGEWTQTDPHYTAQKVRKGPEGSMFKGRVEITKGGLSFTRVNAKRAVRRENKWGGGNRLRKKLR